MSLDKVFEFIEENKQRYVDQIAEFVKVPSISGDPERKDDVRKCATIFVDYLKKIGVEKTELKETDFHPVVYGELITDSSKPTLLLYGHYDVMPAKKEDGWETEPFEPVIKGNYMYGRGVADDKGKMLAPISAVEAYVKTGTPIPINFKILLEGEEETPRGHTEKFIENNLELLSCDAAVLFDTVWIAADQPSITYSLRGIYYWDVDVIGPNRDLHSGIYGGKIRNPMNAAAYMISKLHDGDGRVLIPGFYDDVVPLNDEERRDWAKLPLSDRGVMKDAGVDALWGEKGYTTIERNWARPCLDVHGIWGGAKGEGATTLIPDSAHFKLSVRLVANQKLDRVDESFRKYMKEICPPGVKVYVKTVVKYPPLMVPLDNEYLQDMAKAMELGFGKKPIFVGCGASICITEVFQRLLKAPPLLFDLNVPDESIHGPNEKLNLDIFHDAIKVAVHFFNIVGKK